MGAGASSREAPVASPRARSGAYAAATHVGSLSSWRPVTEASSRVEAAVGDAAVRDGRGRLAYGATSADTEARGGRGPCPVLATGVLSGAGTRSSPQTQAFISGPAV